MQVICNCFNLLFCVIGEVKHFSFFTLIQLKKIHGIQCDVLIYVHQNMLRFDFNLSALPETGEIRANREGLNQAN